MTPVFPGKGSRIEVGIGAFLSVLFWTGIAVCEEVTPAAAEEGTEAATEQTMAAEEVPRTDSKAATPAASEPDEKEASAGRGAGGVVSATGIDGMIHDGVVSLLESSLQSAVRSGSVALLVRLDTPGGLLDSTGDIVQLILNAPLPVIVYVSPSGAQAASAGAIITMAGHIAAMAPGTNIGAATPVSIQGEMPEAMQKKATQHTASYIETIAEQRNRNPEWARKAVIEAESITSRQAEQNGVIDLVASDVDDLLAKIDGRTVEVRGEQVTLSTAGARVVEVQLGWRDRFRIGLADPTLAFLLLVFAVLGIYVEVNNPGLIVPGALGALCAVLFLFAIDVLPFNLFGLLLIALGIVCFVLEMKFTSYGLLALSGVLCFGFGALLLFDVPDQMFDPRTSSQFRVPLAVVLPSTLGMGLFVMGVMYAVVRVQRRQVLTSSEGMLGETGTMRQPLEPGVEGQLFLRGEMWRAVANEPLETGQKVEVIGREGLILKVKKVG